MRAIGRPVDGIERRASGKREGRWFDPAPSPRFVQRNELVVVVVGLVVLGVVVVI